jgi:hypothetical protein
MREKKIEKYLRLKYIREIERYINRIVNFLNTKTDPTKEEFCNFANEKYKKIQECEKILLTKGYPADMEKFADKIIYAANSQKEMDDLKGEILYEANRIRKTKRLRSYKKDKHKKTDIQEY